MIQINYDKILKVWMYALVATIVLAVAAAFIGIGSALNIIASALFIAEGVSGYVMIVFIPRSYRSIIASLSGTLVVGGTLMLALGMDYLERYIP